MIHIILILCLIILILCSGVLSSTETALFSLPSLRVKVLGSSKDARGKSVAALLSKPRKLLVTILMLNIAMNILVQNVVSGIFAGTTSWLLSVGLPLALTLIFGEVIPKSIALAKNDWISLKMAPIILWIEKIVKPLRNAITWITQYISHFFFFFLRKESNISSEELKYALRTSKEYGILSSEEARLIRGCLNLQDYLVKEIKRPRQEILYYDLHEPLERLISYFVDQECSRIPVCDGGVEHILGVISAGSYFLHKNRINNPIDLLPFLKKPFFIPETLPAKRLISRFYEKEESFVIVVDEYGSVSGLVTLEDILEIVIGQISDKRDQKTLYTKVGEGIIIASGKLELSEFEEIFDEHLESPSNMATLGGYLIEHMGNIPKNGEKYVTDKFLFHVILADKNRIRRIYVRKLKASTNKKKNRG